MAHVYLMGGIYYLKRVQVDMEDTGMERREMIAVGMITDMTTVTITITPRGPTTTPQLRPVTTVTTTVTIMDTTTHTRGRIAAEGGGTITNTITHDRGRILAEGGIVDTTTVDTKKRVDTTTDMTTGMLLLRRRQRKRKSRTVVRRSARLAAATRRRRPHRKRKWAAKKAPWTAVVAVINQRLLLLLLPLTGMITRTITAMLTKRCSVVLLRDKNAVFGVKSSETLQKTPRPRCIW
jgi:hypothetical protein